MGGFDDYLGSMGDWLFPSPSPSPRTFFASLMGEDTGSRSRTEPATTENKSRPEQPTGIVNADKNVNGQSDLHAEQKLSACGGLLDRRAARAGPGFNAPRLNTESIRSRNLTIPPGFSPTTSTDSPVFVANSLVQPSPTTGKFEFGSSSGLSVPCENKDDCFERINTSFTFKPIEESRSSLFMEVPSRTTSSSPSQQTCNEKEVAVHPQNSHTSLVEPSRVLSQPDFSKSKTGNDTGGRNHSSEPRSFHATSSPDQPPLDDKRDENIGQIASADLVVWSRLAEDGYNWRKYRQDQVKGSECPRSYYKCTHPKCPVKKKVVWSHEGNITEITYKSAHNHPKTTPNQRPILGSSSAPNDMQLDNVEQAGTDADHTWKSRQKANGCSPLDRRHEKFEEASGKSGFEYGNGPVQSQAGPEFESGDVIDRSISFSYDEDEVDRNTGSVSLGQPGEGEESESKRRKMETCAAETTGANRATKEPRIVVQTTSEVDILDDGYKWRKYGQKIVKGNPNPRSYYKCTYDGCIVRKHVERAPNDVRSVITTYEGKHNHDVPAARGSHVNSFAASSLSTQATSSVQSIVHGPEPSRIHNGMAGFERPPSLGCSSVPWRSQIDHSYGFGFGMNQQGLGNFSMTGLEQGPGISANPFTGQPRHMADDMGFISPKEEPQSEPFHERALNSASSSVFPHQRMTNWPRGPQM